MGFEFDMNPRYDADAAHWDAYLRGVKLVHNMTTLERSSLLLGMGYPTEMVDEHFPVSNLGDDVERQFQATPQMDATDRTSEAAAMHGEDGDSVHPEKKAMLNAMYQLACELEENSEVIHHVVEQEDAYSLLMQMVDEQRDPEAQRFREYYDSHPQKYEEATARSATIAHYLLEHHGDECRAVAEDYFDHEGHYESLARSMAMDIADSEIRLRRGRTPDGQLFRKGLELFNEKTGPSPTL